MKTKLLILIKKSLWLSVEQRRQLKLAIKLNLISSSNEEHLYKILDQAQQEQNLAQKEFFTQHPNLKQKFIDQLNLISKHLIIEKETFFQKQNETNVIQQLETQINNL